MMIQPLGGNIKVYRFLKDPKMVALISVVLLMSFLIINDRLTEWKDIVFMDGGRHVDLRTEAQTVAEFLREQGISLGRLDRLNLPLTAVIARGTQVELYRIEEKLIEKPEPLPFATRTFEAAALPKGKSLVVAEGSAGLAQKVYKVVLKNGVECASELLYRNVVRPSRDRIVFAGTGDVPAGRDITVRVAAARANGSAPLPTLFVPSTFLPENTLVATKEFGRFVVRAPGDGDQAFTVAGLPPAQAGFRDKELRLTLVR